MDRERAINTILKYYQMQRLSWADGELELELESLHREGFKGLENYTDKELATEYQRVIKW